MSILKNIKNEQTFQNRNSRNKLLSICLKRECKLTITTTKNSIYSMWLNLH